MFLEIGRLYNYIFGNWSDLKESISKVPISIENYDQVVSSKQTKAIKNINDFFNGIFDEHQLVKLRTILPKIGAVDLEKILFNTSQANAPKNYFLDEIIIEEFFLQREKKHNYFQNNYASMFEQFKEIYKLCTLMNDLFEKKTK